MSSSGLIYAGIVGAWAVYLVPVWLRREEQLNEARQKARYAAAIRTLGRSEQFEKKWLGDEELAATGTDGVGAPPPGSPPGSGPGSGSAADAAKGKTKPAAVQPKPAPAGRKPAPSAQTPVTQRTQPAATTVSAAQTRKPVVSARIPTPGAASASPSKPVTAGSAKASAKSSPATKSAQRSPQMRHRGVLLMRRRRAVALLFTLATAGAVVSATLGIVYIWAMLAPAALFSGYIVNIRRDEVRRAEERWRRRQTVLAAERRRERDRQRVEAQERLAQTSAASPAPQPAPATVADASDRYYDAQPQPYRRAANG